MYYYRGRSVLLIAAFFMFCFGMARTARADADDAIAKARELIETLQANRDLLRASQLSEIKRLLDSARSIARNSGGNTQSFSATTVCDFADLEVSIFDSNFQRISFLEDYVLTEEKCRTLLNVMPFGQSGRVRAGQQLAFCDYADLEIFGVLPNGTLRKTSDVYQGSQDACWAAARSYNIQGNRN